MGESARRRLERDRDGHRRRRKSRREAERAVRVVAGRGARRWLLRRRHRRALLRGRHRRRARRRADHGVAVHLAVEPVLSEARGEEAASPRLVLVVANTQGPRAALRREAWVLYVRVRRPCSGRGDGVEVESLTAPRFRAGRSSA